MTGAYSYSNQMFADALRFIEMARRQSDPFLRSSLVRSARTTWKLARLVRSLSR
jgi:hypothetical protein